MLTKKQLKIAIAAGVALLLPVLLIVGAGDKFGRLATIMSNIAHNLAHASHGDPRPIETMSAEYIKTHTGSTKEVAIEQLPKAFIPLKEYGHPPFTMGACNVCHAPKRSKPAAIVTETVSELCYACHEPKSEIDTRLSTLDCNKCHSPHHSDRKKLIREKVTELECPVGAFIE